jgi:hypothetical protein
MHHGILASKSGVEWTVMKDSTNFFTRLRDLDYLQPAIQFGCGRSTLWKLPSGSACG